MQLYESLIELDTDALDLLHITIRNRKKNSHDRNKLMLGDLGIVPTVLLGASGALTLKTLFGVQTTYISVIVIGVSILSLISSHVRIEIENYQNVLDSIQSLIDKKRSAA